MYAAGTATKTVSGFDPRSLPGCALWLDAADSSSLTLSGGTTLTAIRDKSPFSNTITTASGSYSATALSGYPGITAPLMNGSFTYGLSSFIHTSFCVAISMGPGAGSAPYPLYEMNCVANGSSNNRVSVLEYNNTGNYFRHARYAGAATRTGTVTASTVFPFIWTARITGATSATFASFNCGSVVGSVAGTASSTSNGLYFNVGTSGFQGGNVASWNGTVSEIITYNRSLTNSEIQAVEGYLSWKWGLPANMPTGHPFRTSLPALRPFTPNDLTTMPILWFDAANLGTITSNTSNVTTWSNQGTYGSNATSNAAGSNTLRTGQDTQNLLNVLSVPANGHLSIPATIFTDNDRSVFYSFKVTSSVDTNEFYPLSSSNTLGGGMLVILYGQAGPIYRYAMHRIGTGDLLNFDTTTNPLNNFYQVCLVNSATTASNAGSWNGSTCTLTTSSAASYTLNEPYNLGNVSRTVTFTLGDMIVYNTALGQAERQQVEGFLAWKWGITSLMPTNHPYRYTMPMTQKFNPRALSNCLFWFDAADLGTITSNTSNITTWSNKGIAQVNALSNSSYTTGRTGINTINGLNVVNFPAAAQMHLSNISTPNLARSVFIVTRNLTELNGNFQGYLNPGDVGGAGWQNLYISGSAGTYNIALGPNGVGFNVGFNTPVNPLNLVSLYGFVNSSSTASNVGTYNGSTMTLTNSAADAYLTTNVPLAILSAAGYNTAQDMGEYIQYDYALTPSDRYRVEGYLAWKWGLSSSLPNNHPFKKFAP